jgi:hypothetical protein
MEYHPSQNTNTEKPDFNKIEEVISTPYIFSVETMIALENLGDVLGRIHKRMVREGYEIIDGTIRKKLAKIETNEKPI